MSWNICIIIISQYRIYYYYEEKCIIHFLECLFLQFEIRTSQYSTNLHIFWTKIYVWYKLGQIKINDLNDKYRDMQKKKRYLTRLVRNCFGEYIVYQIVRIPWRPFWHKFDKIVGAAVLQKSKINFSFFLAVWYRRFWYPQIFLAVDLV